MVRARVRSAPTVSPVCPHLPLVPPVSFDVGTARPLPCPWPWCRSETVLEIGTLRTVGHRSAATRVQLRPDELVISLVAVDGEPPRVVVESEEDDGPVPVVVLDLDQATVLAAGLLACTESQPVEPTTRSSAMPPGEGCRVAPHGRAQNT